MEDRMCQKRGEEPEASMLDLYSEVLHADREMKQLIAGLPGFFRSGAAATPGTPPHITHQRAVLFLSFAHKVCKAPSRSGSHGLICFLQFYSIHRHF